MISFDQAVDHIARVASPLCTEAVALDAAHGRVLASPVIAAVASPWADVSAMDGYAVRGADCRALPVTLRVTGQSLPGQPDPGAIGPGETIRIFTGAPVPRGADRIAIQENVRRDGDRAIVEALSSTAHIRRRGSDFEIGETLVEAGTLLGPGALIAAAGADLAQLTVYRRPRLRLVATGDELTDPRTARDKPGAIPESVSHGVLALAREWGAEPIGRTRLGDNLDTMRRQAPAMLDGTDVLVVTGGASVGDRDFAKAMFGDDLELIFSKVAMKPGKPVWLGRTGDTLIMGLPGNPTSALVTARLFLAPLIAGLTGRDPHDALRWLEAVLAAPLPPPGDRETFTRARWDGERVRPLSNQDSGAQKMLATTELLVRQPACAAGHAASQSVSILTF